MLLLLVGVVAAMELRELYPKGSEPREALKQWHYMLGLTVFALVWVRLLVRLLVKGPPATPGPAWQRRAATGVQIALYGLMIALPLAGWVTLSAEGETVNVFGLALPPLVGENPALAEQVEELHKTGATIGYWLVGVHAAAALAHHYLMHDDTLARMLPRRA